MAARRGPCTSSIAATRTRPTRAPSPAEPQAKALRILRRNCAVTPRPEYPEGAQAAKHIAASEAQKAQATSIAVEPIIGCAIPPSRPRRQRRLCRLVARTLCFVRPARSRGNRLLPRLPIVARDGRACLSGMCHAERRRPLVRRLPTQAVSFRTSVRGVRLRWLAHPGHCTLQAWWKPALGSAAWAMPRAQHRASCGRGCRGGLPGSTPPAPIAPTRLQPSARASTPGKTAASGKRCRSSSRCDGTCRGYSELGSPLARPSVRSRGQSLRCGAAEKDSRKARVTRR